jgi:hydrogenase nickel incorporation protein HypA/HybF
VHEQSLIEALLRRLEQVAATEGASRITAVRVWCGALSHFTPDHFREHFERAAEGTPAEGATLTVEVSDDVVHPDASGIRLKSVEVEG